MSETLLLQPKVVVTALCKLPTSRSIFLFWGSIVGGLCVGLCLTKSSLGSVAGALERQAKTPMALIY